MANVAVVGAQWGDEGKGKIVDWLSERADVVRQIKYGVGVGGIDVVGLGPDWVLGDPARDGPYLHNTDQEDISWTRGLEDSSELPNLWNPLVGTGFTATGVEEIAGGNRSGERR